MSQEFFIEFDSIELGCDHQLLKELEAKNLQKIGIFDQIWLLLRGFWLLPVFKIRGHTQSIYNQFLLVFTTFLTPMATLGVAASGLVKNQALSATVSCRPDIKSVLVCFFG